MKLNVLKLNRNLFINLKLKTERLIMHSWFYLLRLEECILGVIADYCMVRDESPLYYKIAWALTGRIFSLSEVVVRLDMKYDFDLFG